MRTLAVVLLACLATTAAAQPAPQRALAAATALRGPLEGHWRLSSTGGRPLYAFELADPGRGPDPRAASPQTPAVEGAWRDLRRPDNKTASGVFASIATSPGRLVLRISEKGGSTILLHRVGASVWRGWLRSGGAGAAVVMRRPATQNRP